MKAVFDRDAGLSKGIAQIPLQAGQSRQLTAGNAGPQDARTPDIRKSANPLGGEMKAWMLSDDRTERGRQSLDIAPWKVAKEVERQVDPLDGIDPNDFAEWLERVERAGQCRADSAGNLDREKDAPAFGVIRRHDCRP
jgi:hypothetical protein